MTAASLEVLDGGLLTTVQDGGRPAWTHLGVPQSGAADPWSLAVANLLVGNPPDAAALELTLLGARFRVTAPITIGLAGADLGARIARGRSLAAGRSHRLGAGDVLELTGGRRGARAYLAVPGGVDVQTVLGSRSTCLAGGFGGYEGRALRSGDLVAAAGAEPVHAEHAWPTPELASAAGPDDAAILRVLPGPDPGLEAIVGRPWVVAAAADRVGVRLDGERLPDGVGGETTTHGVPWGAIQIPPDGRPIVLGVDHQTTGGYRVPGVVISADRPVLGQLRPGDPVRLAATDARTAAEALHARHQALERGAAALHEAEHWHALIDAAGS
jgi:antagonist of KipI